MRRIVLVTPYTPVAGARLGTARAVHGLLTGLGPLAEVVVVHPSWDGPPDPALAGVVRCVPFGSRPVEGVRRVRDGLALLRGRNLRTAALDLTGLRAVVGSEVDACRAEVVQVEGTDVGDVLAGVAARARVLVVHEPAVRQREALLAGRPTLVRRAEALATSRQERRAVRAATDVVTFSDGDAADLRRAGASPAVIPLGAHVPGEASDPAGRSPSTVLFVGSFGHPPNLDAARWLATDIAPRLARRHPGVEVRLVGASPPPAVRDLAGPHVRVLGDVDSVAPHLDDAAVVVAPLRMGGGARVKVTEALAAGKAVVATSVAAAGIDAAGAGAMRVADGPEAIAAAVGDLLDDVAARTELGGRARAWAEEHLAWPVVARRYLELYEHRLGTP